MIDIFICALLSILSNIDFTNYADDTTPYVIGDGSTEVIDSFKNALADLFCWFASNQMKANPDKRHLTASCEKGKEYLRKINVKTNNKCEKLLVIKIAHKR